MAESAVFSPFDLRGGDEILAVMAEVKDEINVPVALSAFRDKMAEGAVFSPFDLRGGDEILAAMAEGPVFSLFFLRGGDGDCSGERVDFHSGLLFSAERVKTFRTPV